MREKSVRILAVILLVCAGGYAQAVADESPAPAALALEHRPVGEIVSVLAPLYPGIVFREDPFRDALLVEVPPATLQSLRDTLAVIDVPRPEANLTIYLLWGRKTNFAGDVPEMVRGAESTLRRQFAYTRYDLENKLYVPSLERASGKVEILPDHFLEYRIDKVSPEDRAAEIRLEISRANMDTQKIESVVQGVFRVAHGKPAVLGGIPAPVDPASRPAERDPQLAEMMKRYIVLVVEVDVPPSASPQKITLIDQPRG